MAEQTSEMTKKLEAYIGPLLSDNDPRWPAVHRDIELSRRLDTIDRRLSTMEAAEPGPEWANEIERRISALESPTRPLAPPADAEQKQLGVPEALAMVMDALTCRAPDRCGGSGSHNACSACRTLPVVEALADRLAPSTHVRTCADCGTRHTLDGGELCPLCQAHQDGYAKRCAEERERVASAPKPATATAEPPFRQETGRTDYGGPQIDAPEPATVKEPLTAEDGLRERAEEAAARIMPTPIHSATEFLELTDGRRTVTASVDPPQAIRCRQWVREIVRDALLAFARAAPTARATTNDLIAYEAKLIAPVLVGKLKGLGWLDADVAWLMVEKRAETILRLAAGVNPPATAGGSKNKGEAS